MSWTRYHGAGSIKKQVVPRKNTPTLEFNPKPRRETVFSTTVRRNGLYRGKRCEAQASMKIKYKNKTNAKSQIDDEQQHHFMIGKLHS